MAGRILRELRGVRSIWRPRVWLFTGLARILPDFTLASIRTELYRLAGCDIERGAAILGSIRLVGSGNVASRLCIKTGCVVAPHVILGLDGPITLGKNASVGPGSTLYTGTHTLGFGSQRMTPGTVSKEIVVHDGAWIGMDSLIMPGITVGQGAVVSGGSVVSSDVEPNTLVAGNPATMQQKLPFGNR